MFVHCSYSRHCQDGAFCTASVSEVKNNDFCHSVYSCVHCLYYFSQHITPPCSSSIRIWKDGKKSKYLYVSFISNMLYSNKPQTVYINIKRNNFIYFSKLLYIYCWRWHMLLHQRWFFKRIQIITVACLSPHGTPGLEINY